jgi:hypothetical protein
MYSINSSSPTLNKMLGSNWLFPIVFGLIHLGYLLFTGVIFNTYQVMEDHEIFDYIISIKEKGFLSFLIDQIQVDMQGRFRPFYIFFRITQSYIFQDNWVLWHLLFAGLAIISSTFFAIAATRLNIGRASAILVGLLIFAGTQSDSLIRLGTSELWGAFFLSIAVLLSGRRQESNWGIDFAVALFLLLSISCKEIFLTIIPFLILYRFLVFYQPGQFVLSVVKKNSKYLTAIIIGGFFASYFIFFYAAEGLSESVYAGIDTDFNKFFATNLLFFSEPSNRLDYFSDAAIYLLFSLLLYGISLFTSELRSSKYNMILQPFILLALLLYHLLTHLILYKIYFGGHYLIPYVIPVSYFIAYQLSALQSVKIKLAKVLVSFLMVCFVFFQLSKAIKVAQDHVASSKAIRTISSLIKSQNPQADELLVVGDVLCVSEFASAITKYLLWHKEIHSFKVQLVEGDESIFLQLSKTRDTTLLPIFREVFVSFWADNALPDSIPPHSFKNILIIGAGLPSKFTNQYIKANHLDSYSKLAIPDATFNHYLLIR